MGEENQNHGNGANDSSKSEELKNPLPQTDVNRIKLGIIKDNADEKEQNQEIPKPELKPVLEQVSEEGKNPEYLKQEKQPEKKESIFKAFLPKERLKNAAVAAGIIISILLIVLISVRFVSILQTPTASAVRILQGNKEIRGDEEANKASGIEQLEKYFNSYFNLASAEKEGSEESGSKEDIAGETKTAKEQAGQPVNEKEGEKNEFNLMQMANLAKIKNIIFSKLESLLQKDQKDELSGRENGTQENG